MIIELHTVVDFQNKTLLGVFCNSIYKSLRKFEIRNIFLNLARETAINWFWKSIYKEIATATKDSGSIVVHRNKDLDVLRTYIRNTQNVYVQDLDSLTSEMASFTIKPSTMFSDPKLSQLDTLLQENMNKFLLVQPGFISQYKGHSISFDALVLLPNYVHLVVLGEIHGVVADSSSGVAKMTKDLQIQLASLPKSVLSRIHFIPTPTDIEIAAAIYSSDAVLLPYIETGQSGSGPLSESRSLGAQIICSNIPAFRNENGYHPNLHYFDVGNVYQIRDLVISLMSLRRISKNTKRRKVHYPWSELKDELGYKDFLKGLADQTSKNV
jgi:glycosyltransferase involved in cell wall biosynthesis